MGDFNTVVCEEDRWDTHNDRATGARDKGEEEHWRETVANPLSLYELQQEQFTFKCSSSRSRIDRIYTNQPASDQLDPQICCAALEWTPRLSDHRAVAFARTSSPVSPQGNRPIQDWILKHERFPCVVADIFRRKCAGAGAGKRKPLLELKLLKEAIQEAAEEIKFTKKILPELVEDKAGAYLCLLRAMAKRAQ